MQCTNGSFFADVYPLPYSERMAIGNRLDKAMFAAGFKSQSELAARSGVPQATISRILSNLGKKGPETETLKKLAKACRVPFDWLNEGAAGSANDEPPTAPAVDDPDEIADEIIQLITDYRNSTPEARRLILFSAADSPKLDARKSGRTRHKGE